MAKAKHRILILGASGFLGYSIYKELSQFYKTFGTYCTPKQLWKSKSNFFEFNLQYDDIIEILELVKPTIIISAVRGPFPSQMVCHKHLLEYLEINDKTKILFLSSANVFDAYSKYPSYETDTTLSNSIYGHFKIRIEQQLLRLPKQQVSIIRIPMVFGPNAPRIRELLTLNQLDASIELFPNLVMNISTNQWVTRQIHYIINRNKSGIFHCGSSDLVHHDDFIKDMVRHLKLKEPKFKFVFTTNDIRYLAVLPKYNLLPTHLQFDSQSIFDDIITAS
mgnify:CR=1 FL=1